MKNPQFRTAAIITLLLGTTAAALIAGPAPQSITVTGKGRCSKCGTKETVICQSVVVVEAGKEKAVYVLVDNAVSDEFHKKVGTATKAVTVTGTLQRVGQRLKLTATKFEMAE